MTPTDLLRSCILSAHPNRTLLAGGDRPSPAVDWMATLDPWLVARLAGEVAAHSCRLQTPATHAAVLCAAAQPRLLPAGRSMETTQPSPSCSSRARLGRTPQTWLPHSSPPSWFLGLRWARTPPQQLHPHMSITVQQSEQPSPLVLRCAGLKASLFPRGNTCWGFTACNHVRGSCCAECLACWAKSVLHCRGIPDTLPATTFAALNLGAPTLGWPHTAGLCLRQQLQWTKEQLPVLPQPAGRGQLQPQACN